MPGSELTPMHPHFLADWIITHHLHPLVLPPSTAPGKPDHNWTPRWTTIVRVSVSPRAPALRANDELGGAAVRRPLE